MRVVVASCFKYRDTWKPFLALFERFYGGPITLLTDRIEREVFPHWVTLHLEDGSWSEMLAKYARKQSEPILLFQDDFFLTDTVIKSVVHEAEKEMRRWNAGCVRLYPCPGGIQEYGNPYFAEVPKGTEYRISCQASLWKPEYLATLARLAGGKAMHFELLGNHYANSLDEPVLAFKREVYPWPMEYLCSAISKGKWNPDAKVLCDSLGIEADFTQRPMMAV